MFYKIRKNFTLLITTMAATSLLIVPACGSEDSSDAEKPLIVATTNILSDVVSKTVGDVFNVETIMPVGADPHVFQASAKQVDKMMNADLLVVNGANFEEGLVDVIEAAESDGVKVFEAMSFVDPLESHDDHAKEEDHDEHDHDDHHGHDHGGVDPHFFTDPGRMLQVVNQLSDFLVLNFSQIDEGDLLSHSAEYSKKLEDLDSEVMQTLSSIPAASRVLVTNHQVFAYFAEAYQFEILGSIIPSSSTLSNTSAKDLVDLSEKMKANGTKAIFVDASSSDALADALAEEVDVVQVVSLFSESLGSENSEGSTYIDMVRTNSKLIANALTG